MTLEETLEKIHPADKTAMEAALAHWNNIAMPLHSLGRLQDTVVRIAGMTGNARVDLKKKALVVMCADNGVVEEGVTQSGQEVTKIVAENFLKEKATASILCKKAGADIFPVDIGIATDSTILQHKVMYGTKNMAKEPAMTREQAVQALEVGIHMVEELKEKGYGIIATGEMGIGNTTTSSAVTAVLLEQDPAEVTGRGAGLSGTGLKKKISVIRDAIALHKPKKEDPICARESRRTRYRRYGRGILRRSSLSDSGSCRWIHLLCGRIVCDPDLSGSERLCNHITQIKRTGDGDDPGGTGYSGIFRL